MDPNSGQWLGSGFSRDQPPPAQYEPQQLTQSQLDQLQGQHLEMQYLQSQQQSLQEQEHQPQQQHIGPGSYADNMGQWYRSIGPKPQSSQPPLPPPPVAAAAPQLQEYRPQSEEQFPDAPTPPLPQQVPPYQQHLPQEYNHLHPGLANYPNFAFAHLQSSPQQNQPQWAAPSSARSHDPQLPPSDLHVPFGMMSRDFSYGYPSNHLPNTDPSFSQPLFGGPQNPHQDQQQQQESQHHDMTVAFDQPWMYTDPLPPQGHFLPVTNPVVSSANLGSSETAPGESRFASYASKPPANVEWSGGNDLRAMAKSPQQSQNQNRRPEHDDVVVQNATIRPHPHESKTNGGLTSSLSAPSNHASTTQATKRASHSAENAPRPKKQSKLKDGQDLPKANRKIKAQVEKLFQTCSNATTLKIRFRDLVLSISKERFGVTDPDEMQTALATAWAMPGSDKLWAHFEGETSFLSRLRNWLAHWANKKQFSNITIGLKILKQIPMTNKELDFYKLRKVLKAIASRGDPELSAVARGIENSTIDTRKPKPADTQSKEKQPEEKGAQSDESTSDGRFFSALQSQKAATKTKPSVPQISTKIPKDRGGGPVEKVEKVESKSSSGGFMSMMNEIHKNKRPVASSSSRAPLKKKKKSKSVHWPNDKELVHVREFVREPDELVNMKPEVNEDVLYVDSNPASPQSLKEQERQEAKSLHSAAGGSGWQKPKLYAMKPFNGACIKRGGMLRPKIDEEHPSQDAPSPSQLEKKSPSPPATIPVSEDLQNDPAIIKMNKQTLPSTDVLEKILAGESSPVIPNDNENRYRSNSVHIPEPNNSTIVAPPTGHPTSTNNMAKAEGKLAKDPTAQAVLSLRQTDVRPQVNTDNRTLGIWRELCRYNLMGTCRRGNDCTHIHQRPV